jgi:hypothetical protein
MKVVVLFLLLSFSFWCIEAFSPMTQPVLSALAQIPQNHPVVLAVAITSIKTGGADFLAQKLASTAVGGRGLDKRRLGCFTLYGAVYLGWFQHFLFSKVYTKLFPLASEFAAKSIKEKLKDVLGASSVLQQVIFEASVHWPWLFIPAFYLLQEITAPKFAFSNLRNTLKQNWKEDLITCWKIWIPASMLNFSCIPLHSQVPFTALVGFAYMAYFSFKRGGAR